MVAEQGSREQVEAETLCLRTTRTRSERSSSRIEDITFDYLSGQIAAGADAVQ